MQAKLAVPSVLVSEDEALISLDLCETIAAAGLAVVGLVQPSSPADVLKQLADLSCRAARN